MVTEEFLTRAQVADLLQVATSTVDRWIMQGRLPQVKAGPRRVLIRRTTLERWLTEREPLAVARMRYRIEFSPTMPDDETEQAYEDEDTAIMRGKEAWTIICEPALERGWKATVTVINRQQEVCWERQVPIVLARDYTLQDEAWLLQVLREHGPLSGPQLPAVAGLKPAAIRTQLKRLKEQGRIQRLGELNTQRRGRRGVLWDIVDASGTPSLVSTAGRHAEPC